MATHPDNLNPATLAGNPRATLQAWLRYDGFVLAAFRAHPQTFSFIPTTLSPISVCSKIRDAVRGKIAFDYPFTVPDAPASDVFARWWNSVCVWNDATTVYIGKKEKPILRKLAAVVQTTDPFVFPSLTLAEVLAFETLLSSGRLRGPVTITAPPLLSSPPLPNVERIYRSDNSLILL